MNRNPESLPNIRRIDSSPKAKRQTHGWQVHFERGGVTKTKHFSDGVYRSKEEARSAAIAFRDALKPTLPLSVNERGYRETSNSNTGYSGISYTFDRRVVNPNTPCFSASVNQRSGEPINRKFYVENEADYDTVLKEAVAWRNSVLEERLLSLEAQNKEESEK